VPLVIAVVIVFLLMFAMWIAVAIEKGPAPGDVALAYERAWDDLDFALLYELSGNELRDGMRKDQFVAAKREAYAGAENTHRLAARVEVETVVVGHETALVVTRVSADEGSVRNNVVLERRANGWVVVQYSLRPNSDSGVAAS
jgi:hypothetical protein